MRLAQAVAAFLVAASPLQAQQPTLPADTLAGTDSARVVLTPDTLSAESDTIPDSLRVHVLPEANGRAPVGVATNVIRAWLCPVFFGRRSPEKPSACRNSTISLSV